MSRMRLISDIEQRIGDRRLVWFGTRGSDAAPLRKSIEQFAGVFSLIAPLGMATWTQDREACLEELSGERVDLNAYTIDDDRSDAAADLHRRMMSTLGGGSVVAAYRSCHFISAACHALGAQSELLSMFHGVQSAFDYKPWVESALGGIGIRTIPWRYFSHHDWPMINERPPELAHVLRASYSDGGLGLRRLAPGAQLTTAPDWTSDRLVAMSAELTPNVPLNVGACVFPDGRVTVHAPSLQLIGIPSCTRMPFGYCGNDFGAVGATLTPRQLHDLEDMTVETGKWMWRHGYRGAFGIDALVFEDALILAEVNARFQGSSAISARIDADLGLADIYLDHLAALLGIPVANERPTLAEQAQLQMGASTVSQVVTYSAAGTARRSSEPVPDLSWAEIAGMPLSQAITVHPNGMLFKLLIDHSVTNDGFAIEPDLAKRIDDLRGTLFARD